MPHLKDHEMLGRLARTTHSQPDRYELVRSCGSKKHRIVYEKGGRLSFPDHPRELLDAGLAMLALGASKKDVPYCSWFLWNWRKAMANFYRDGRSRGMPSEITDRIYHGKYLSHLRQEHRRLRRPNDQLLLPLRDRPSLLERCMTRALTAYGRAREGAGKEVRPVWFDLIFRQHDFGSGRYEQLTPAIRVKTLLPLLKNSRFFNKDGNSTRCSYRGCGTVWVECGRDWYENIYRGGLACLEGLIPIQVIRPEDHLGEMEVRGLLLGAQSTPAGATTRTKRKVKTEPREAAGVPVTARLARYRSGPAGRVGAWYIRNLLSTY